MSYFEQNVLFVIILNQEISSFKIIKIGQSNFRIVFILASGEENGYYRVVLVGQLSFDCRMYCGLSCRMREAWGRKPITIENFVIDMIITIIIKKQKHVPCFCRVIETQVEVWENEITKHRAKERKTCKFSLLMPSLRQQLMLVLCLHWVKETQFSTNQCAYFF